MMTNDSIDDSHFHLALFPLPDFIICPSSLFVCCHGPLVCSFFCLFIGLVLFIFFFIYFLFLPFLFVLLPSSSPVMDRLFARSPVFLFFLLYLLPLPAFLICPFLFLRFQRLVIHFFLCVFLRVFFIGFKLFVFFFYYVLVSSSCLHFLSFPLMFSWTACFLLSFFSFS